MRTKRVQPPSPAAHACAAPRALRGVRLGAVGAILLLASCAPTSRDPSIKRTGTPPANIGARQGANAPGKPLPDATKVVAAYNARVLDLDRFKAPVTLLIDSPDDKGGRRRDQVEGSMQWMLPTSFSLRVDKVGQTLYVMGSNPQRYWWLELGDPKRAFAGQHALATQDKAQHFGLPVLPRDLIELLGVTPLPSAKVLSFAWSASGDLLVSVPGLLVSRRLTLDPATYEPRAIELHDREGHLVVRSTLGAHIPVAVDGNVFSKAKVARSMDVVVPGADASATIAIIEPTNPGEKLRTNAFDYDAVLASYGVKIVTDVDAPPAGGH